MSTTATATSRPIGAGCADGDCLCAWNARHCSWTFPRGADGPMVCGVCGCGAVQA